MSGPGDVFDVKKIRRLVQLMEEHGLNEVDLEQGEQRIRLRRHSEVQAAAVPAAVAPPSVGPPAQPTPAAPAAEAANIVAIKSPMVGTFYAAQNPESPPFVKVGDHVGKETPVCIVEAMKVFNEIPAGTAGKIVAVLVENGEPVEYAQPLFKVDTSA
jgi:acetyl-CoA carboxylase biotin carboxyl carrier protein